MSAARWGEHRTQSSEWHGRLLWPRLLGRTGCSPRGWIWVFLFHILPVRPKVKEVATKEIEKELKSNWLIFSPNLKKSFFFVFNMRMSLRAVVYQDGPEDEPETSEGPKYVENWLPAQVLAEITGGRHGDHCSKGSPSTDEGCEPEYYY